MISQLINGGLCSQLPKAGCVRLLSSHTKEGIYLAKGESPWIETETNASEYQCLKLDPGQGKREGQFRIVCLATKRVLVSCGYDAPAWTGMPKIKSLDTNETYPTCWLRFEDKDVELIRIEYHLDGLPKQPAQPKFVASQLVSNQSNSDLKKAVKPPAGVEETTSWKLGAGFWMRWKRQRQVASLVLPKAW